MKHILFTLYDCDRDLLNDRMYIENVLYETANQCGVPGGLADGVKVVRSCRRSVQRIAEWVVAESRHCSWYIERTDERGGCRLMVNRVEALVAVVGGVHDGLR